MNWLLFFVAQHSVDGHKRRKPPDSRKSITFTKLLEKQFLNSFWKVFGKTKTLNLFFLIIGKSRPLIECDFFPPFVQISSCEGGREGGGGVILFSLLLLRSIQACYAVPSFGGEWKNNAFWQSIKKGGRGDQIRTSFSPPYHTERKAIFSSLRGGPIKPRIHAS